MSAMGHISNDATLKLTEVPLMEPNPQNSAPAFHYRSLNNATDIPSFSDDRLG